jgi:hypothetical protein
MVLSVNTWPEMSTTTGSRVVFVRTPEVKFKSPFSILFTSGVSKGTEILTLGVPIGHKTLGATATGSRYQVCEGRGRMGTEAPVGPVIPVGPVGPVGPLIFESWVKVMRVLLIPIATFTRVPGKKWV